jgi:hypothetical protein
LTASTDSRSTGTKVVQDNLRTQLEQIIRKAGLEPWPKLWQNLRSTRETELAETTPLHVVCAWIGNSRAVAAKHYLQIRDEDFDRAADVPHVAGPRMGGGAKSGAQNGQTGAHKQAQPTSADARQPS